MASAAAPDATADALRKVAEALLLLQQSTPDVNKALTEHFNAQELRLLQPWRMGFQQACFQLDAFEKLTTEGLRKQAVSACKAKQLSANDVLSLTYTLFADQAAANVYAAILLDRPPEERIMLHNWYVARVYVRNRGDQWLHQHGAAVAMLKHPFFPPTEDFDSLNLKLLRTCEAVSAAGVDGKGAADDLYLRPSFPNPKKNAAKSADVTGGALPFPVISDGAGGACVDLQSVLDAFTGMQRQIAQLQDRHVPRSYNGFGSNAPNNNNNNTSNNGNNNNFGGYSQNPRPSRADRRRAWQQRAHGGEVPPVLALPAPPHPAAAPTQPTRSGF